jgi:SAM-dependent methyltransferase
MNYDETGAGYVSQRRPDPRLVVLIEHALGDADSVVNVGAGAGYYEPRDRRVVAVEPALAMIRQRARGAAPVVRAGAEALPFPDASFAAALAVLTIHHWVDWQAGLRELLRVSRGKIVLFTWDPQSEGFWLCDYFPRLLEMDRQRFPTLTALRTVLGEIQAIPVPIPHDCSDGFMGAYWRRPSAYLDPEVRAAISSLATGAPAVSLARLADDLRTGVWERKYARVLDHDAVDLGYRLVVAMGRSISAGDY